LVQVNVPTDLTVAADRPILLALLHNLFSNAAAHAPAGARVNVDATLERAGTPQAHVRLIIANDNANVTEADLPHLAEPCWQKDTPRPNPSGAHAGLGLALVREYASALNLSVRYALIEGNRFAVELTWPPATTTTVT